MQQIDQIEFELQNLLTLQKDEPDLPARKRFNIYHSNTEEYPLRGVSGIKDCQE